jgi:hypothetical protein
MNCSSSKCVGLTKNASASAHPARLTRKPTVPAFADERLPLRAVLFLFRRLQKTAIAAREIRTQNSDPTNHAGSKPFHRQESIANVRIVADLSACPRYSDRPDLKNREHRDELEITELSRPATKLILPGRVIFQLGRFANRRADYDKMARF